MSEGTRVLVGLGVGLGTGLAIAASHSPALLSAADSVAPIGTLWVNAIRMTVIPLIVSLVITGVASASSVGTVGSIGRRTIAVFIAMLTAAMILALPLGIAVFSWMSRIITVRPELPPGAAEAANSLATSATPVDFGSWLISLVPTNPIAAAANGAMLALAIAQAPADGRDVLLRFFRGLGDAMQVLVRWVIWCAPVGIFALMLPLGAHGGAGFVGA